MRSKKIHKMLKINTLHTFFRSILGARTGLFALASLLLMGCSAEKTPEKAARPCGELPPLEFAKKLKIGDSCGIQMAEIRSIVGRDTLIRRFRRSAPLSRVVALSSAQIGYMLRLGEQGRIIAVGDGKYIADSALYQNVTAGAVAQVGSGPTLSLEKLMELQPQLVMSFATGGGQDDYERIEALGLPLMLTSEWQEEHPLAKAEWIKLYGMLFGMESQADSVFEQIKKNYVAIANSKQAVGDKAKEDAGVDKACFHKATRAGNVVKITATCGSSKEDAVKLADNAATQFAVAVHDYYEQGNVQVKNISRTESQELVSSSNKIVSGPDTVFQVNSLQLFAFFPETLNTARNASL